MPRLLLVNGPNLNLLGTREPDLYGHDTLADAERRAAEVVEAAGGELRTVQSNHEGVLVDAVQEARHDCDGVIINPGGLTHTSVVLRDALTAIAKPVAEVHVTNIHSREEWRHHSYFSDIAAFSIIGAGIDGYAFAAQRLLTLLRTADPR